MRRIIFIFYLAINVVVPVFSDENDEIKRLLLAEEGGNIEALSKINLGIPGGDNWIANRSDGYTYIYIVDNEKRVRTVRCMHYIEQAEIRFRDINIRSNVDLEFDIMQNIPGTRLGSKAVAFGDYNGDGFDEIFFLSMAVESSANIWGYNNGEMKLYFGCRITITDRKGPSPVEFINYKGVDGIKVGLLGFPVERYIWYFYAWDEGSRKYKELTELGENAEYSSFTIIGPEDSRHIGNEPVFPSVLASDETEAVVDNSASEITENSDERNNRQTPSWVWAAIGGGALLIVCVVVIIKRKK
ncbi:MAG: hypothetical protein FWG99_11910 [Treponema sp.]|nr:hypothetical protein [Treponema sp.]